jgi:hypothetical protein
LRNIAAKRPQAWDTWHRHLRDELIQTQLREGSFVDRQSLLLVAQVAREVSRALFVAPAVGEGSPS